MAGEALGHKSYMQWAREATWGTAVPATRRGGLIESTPTLQTGVILDPTLDNSVSRTAQYQGRRRVRARIRTRLDYESYGLFWDSLFGTASFGSLGATTTGAGPYVHTLVEKSILNSLAVQLIEGDIPTGKCSTLEGLKLSGVRISGEQGDGERGLCYTEWDGAAEDYAEDQTPTASLTAYVALPVLTQDVTTQDDGTADTVKMRSFEITVRNPVEEEGALGQVQIEEPFRNDFLEIKAVFRKIYKTKTLHAAARAFTAGSPKLVFGSAATKRMTLDVGTANVEVYQHPVRGYGVVLQEVTWNAIKDATNASALKMTIENNRASADMW